MSWPSGGRHQKFFRPTAPGQPGKTLDHLIALPIDLPPESQGLYRPMDPAAVGRARLGPAAEPADRRRTGHGFTLHDDRVIASRGQLA